MKGYVLALIKVEDAQGYAAYSKDVLATITAHGGRFIVRNGAKTQCEGQVPAERVVILEFPSVEQARTWYDSKEYQAIAPLRQAASKGSLTIIEGWGGE